MADLQDLIDQLIGAQTLYAVDLIRKKNLSGVDADILLLQARAQGLEESIKQIALKIEQLPAFAQNEPRPDVKNAPAPEGESH
jgi:hypothetical protein